MKAKSTLRLALTGVALLIASGVVVVVVTFASAAEYNATEQAGAVVGAPSIGIYVGLGVAAVLAVVGAVLIVASIITAIRSQSRQSQAVSA